MTTAEALLLLVFEFAIFGAAVTVSLVRSRGTATPRLSGTGVTLLAGTIYIVGLGFLVVYAVSNPDGPHPAAGLPVAFVIALPIAVFFSFGTWVLQVLRKR